jgi:hypothetical protein
MRQDHSQSRLSSWGYPAFWGIQSLRKPFWRRRLPPNVVFRERLPFDAKVAVNAVSCGKFLTKDG